MLDDHNRLSFPEDGTQNRSIPSFLGIGAQRSGTGWMFRNLVQHPDIWITPVKELHYFDRLDSAHGFSDRIRSRPWRRGAAARLLRDCFPGRRGSISWDLRYFFGTRSDDWYRSLFRPAGDRHSGEITPSYSTLGSDVVAHVRAFAPNLRMIFLMRDPVQRAWSHAINRLVGVERLRFDDITEDQFIAHIGSEDSMLRTDYTRTIRNWEAHFPVGQIFYGFYDDVIQQPKELMERIFAFLQVDPVPKNPLFVGRAKPQMGSRYRMPARVQLFASQKYMKLITELNSRFGGHTEAWVATARAILERSETRS